MNNLGVNNINNYKKIDNFNYFEYINNYDDLRHLDYNNAYLHYILHGETE
jgi:hypothetical protein